MNRSISLLLSTPLLLLYCNGFLAGQELKGSALQGTTPLTMEGDIAARLVEGVDRFLLQEIERSIALREQHFQRDFTSPVVYQRSLKPNRERLAHILGVRDERPAFDALEFVSSTSESHLVATGDGYKVYAVRWPALHNVHGEGLWLVPDAELVANGPVANVIAIPDADQTPELICGLEAGLPPENQFARQLALNGCCVLVPTLIDREFKARNGRAKMTSREYLYRSAYVLGRHLIGYEVQKVLAAVDWFERASESNELPIGVIGNGEGGMLALYAAALDPRIDSVCVGGYFGSRQQIWQQPLSRNVFGLLEAFGDAELASMVVPRNIIIDENGAPTLELPSGGGAPAVLTPATNADVTAELARLSRIVEPLEHSVMHVAAEQQPMPAMAPDATLAFWKSLRPGSDARFTLQTQAIDKLDNHRAAGRQQRQFHELEQHNQWQLGESDALRRGFLNLGSNLYDSREGRFKLDTSSTGAYRQSIEPYRDYFRDEVIGHFQEPLMDFNARSRVVYDRPTWTGYEVVLDVFPDVIAYGILCLPKNMKPGEKRPVVVCQHGLEGRPQDTIAGDHPAYHDFAAKLAERGYITFAPQNLYIGHDKFRTLQRKAYPLKKTLFSIIVPQHQQIVNWLKSQPNVDAEHIAFYGLSYGGKSAMRIPPLVPDYCLSICSGDFNDWVDKNASTRENYSYVWTNEYEIFEFDLGSTFNYAEMAALIAPRPFMVERGHYDAVGIDERVASEFAKVRFLYSARLGIPERCAIEWFNGPHTINGKGTFDFLDRHLK
ncbi:MAG: dienelactone hydrolase family protein [Pirellulaceae bacterium]|nr:dienelactone hydrolase family protein [Pirellulaceae bacterium]